jgi:hypothetical protein
LEIYNSSFAERMKAIVEEFLRIGAIARNSLIEQQETKTKEHSQSKLDFRILG